MQAPADRRQLALIAAGYMLGLATHSRLAEPFLPWGVVGGLMTAFMLPTAAAVNYIVFRQVTSRNGAAIADEASAAAIREIGFRITAFEIAIHVLILANLTGVLGTASIVPARLVVVLFGLLLIGIGDLLPRTRPNLAVGIRTRLTLRNRDVWMRLHRIAGYAAVSLGAVIVLSGAFLGHPAIAQAINAGAIGAVTAVGLSYRRFSRRARAA
jgi:hypothetical protein